VIIISTCIHGEEFGNPMRHEAIGDGLFFHGRWPPEYEGTSGTIQCRKFHDPTILTTDAFSQGGNTHFLRSSLTNRGWNEGACTVDWLVPGAGYVPNSVCLSAYAHGWVDPDGTIHDGHLGEMYMETVSNTCDGLFDQVAISFPDIEFLEVEDSHIDPRVVSLQNAVVEISKTQTLPLQDSGGVTFDRLDHQAASTRDNAFLGTYERSWDATTWEGEPGTVIGDARLPVVGIYPASRTKYGWESVFAELVLVRVIVSMDLQLHHSKLTSPSGPFVDGNRSEFVAPHAVVRIRAWLGLRVQIEGESQATYTGSVARWPEISPAGNQVLLASEPGKFWAPPACIEWRGQLNDFSYPNLEDQGYPAEATDNLALLLYGPACKTAATAAGTWRMPGTAVYRDRFENDPEAWKGPWGGEMTATFIGTPGYDGCTD
jgi:hypothetical protein